MKIRFSSTTLLLQKKRGEFHEDHPFVIDSPSVAGREAVKSIEALCCGGNKGTNT